MTEPRQSIRISPHIHKMAKIEAAKDGKGLQEWVERLIADAVSEKIMQEINGTFIKEDR